MGNTTGKISTVKQQCTLGTFASVKLCKHPGRSSYCALKVMAINEILKLKQVEHVRNEKKILKVKNNTSWSRFQPIFQSIKHPFLIELLWSSVDRRNLYLLFPYVAGGELFYHLRSAGKFPLVSVRFYSAEIISALSYLHTNNIVYRSNQKRPRLDKKIIWIISGTWNQRIYFLTIKGM